MALMKEKYITAIASSRVNEVRKGPWEVLRNSVLRRKRMLSVWSSGKVLNWDFKMLNLVQKLIMAGAAIHMVAEHAVAWDAWLHALKED